MPVRQAIAVTMLLVAVCGCSKYDSSFDQECRSVRAQLSAGVEPTHSDGPRRDGYSLNASWQFEFRGNRDAAMRSFESRIPAAYKPMQRTASELGLVRSDGNDSFSLTLTFDSAAQDSTTVRVNLRSIPD